jgi:hypothetical protein
MDDRYIPVSSYPTAIFLHEAAFAKSLERCSSLLHERFKTDGSFRWVAGMEGIDGRSLTFPNDAFGSPRPGASGVIEREGSFSIGDDPVEALEPFFETVFDQCETRRPQK